MFRFHPNETFKEIAIPDPLKLRYAISNKGRLISFENDMKNGRELKGGLSDGYRIFRYKVRVEDKLKNKHLFLCKLIAEYFIPKASPDQQYVLHLDYVRDNDKLENLRWATREEMLAHSKKSPHVIDARKKLVEHNIKSDGKKLTATKVMLIKKLLQKPDRTTRLKMLAKQFNISQTQLKRIERGENWGHIKV